jgi:hypothetical protein
MKPNQCRPAKDSPRSAIDNELEHDYVDWLPTPAAIRAACLALHDEREFPEDGKRPPVQARSHRTHIEV